MFDIIVTQAGLWSTKNSRTWSSASYTKTLFQKPLIQHLTKAFHGEDLQSKSRDESAQFCDDRVVTVPETISKLL